MTDRDRERRVSEFDREMELLLRRAMEEIEAQAVRKDAPLGLEGPRQMELLNRLIRRVRRL